MPFSFLGNLGQTISDYLAPAVSTVKSIFDSLLPKQKIYAQSSAPAPQVAIPTPSAVPNVPSRPTPDVFSAGFNNFAPNVPVASRSADFAKAATQLPSPIDALLPAVIALMETGGGTNMVASNNPFNIRGQQGGETQFINYPDITTALLGGANGPDISQGLVGTLLNNPAYNSYRQTGNLEDFFRTYTPPGPAYGNPSMEELLARYNSLRSLFPGY